jgi:hypothetical protein
MKGDSGRNGFVKHPDSILTEIKMIERIRPPERSLGMSTTMSRASSTSPSCVYLSAEPFFWDVFGGIPRYTVRLGLALAAHVPVRFFLGAEEVLAPESLGWSQDQDLEQWGRTIARAERRPLGTPASDCIGLYCLARIPWRTFRYAVNILHDF